MILSKHSLLQKTISEFFYDGFVQGSDIVR